MTSLKVNHLVNLQDARYCAALDVAMLSFCLERGNMYRLPDTMIADIVEWITGPKIVFNFGSDTEELNNFLPRTLPTEVWHELVYSPEVVLPARAMIRLTRPDDLHVPTFEMILNDEQQEAYIELDLPPDYGKEMIAFYKELKSYREKIILNMDHYDLSLLSQLPYLPAIISVRSCVEEDLMNLDYDKFESLLSFLEQLTGKD